MKTPHKSLLSLFARFCIYFAAMVVLNTLFMYDATHFTATGKFGEISLTERTQAFVLFLVFSGFFAIGWKYKPLRHLAFVLSLFFVMSFIREFNEALDHWFYYVLPFLLVFGFVLIRYFKQIIDGLLLFVKSPSSSLFMAGFLVTYVFSRFFGREKFWKALMEDGYMRMVKATAEEGVELLGYTLLLVALVEFWVSIPRLLKKD